MPLPFYYYGKNIETPAYLILSYALYKKNRERLRNNFGPKLFINYKNFISALKNKKTAAIIIL